MNAGHCSSRMSSPGGDSSVPSCERRAALPAAVAWNGTTKLVITNSRKFAGTSGWTSCPSSHPPAAAATGCQGTRRSPGSAGTSRPAERPEDGQRIAIQRAAWVSAKRAQTAKSAFHRRSTSRAATSDREADQPDVRPAHLHPLGEQRAEPGEREHEPPGARRAHDPQRRRERADQEDLAEQRRRASRRVSQRQPGEGHQQEMEQRLAVGEVVVGDRERRPAERRDAEARGEHLPGQPQVVVLVVRPGEGSGEPHPRVHRHHGGAG